MKRSPKRKSVMVHDFSRIASANIPRSKFSLSHGWKGTIDEAGKLYPFFLQEVVPGDTHSVTAQVFGRLATPIHPIFDNLVAETFFFFCGNRLVWNNWPKFLGEQDNPGDSTDFTIPKMQGNVLIENSIGDYFGLPIGSSGQKLSYNDVAVSALPFRMYNLIFRDWFRDENLIDSPPVNMDDGPDDAQTDYKIFNRGKRHDYLTSCLPWPQKGPGATIPLTGNADVFTDQPAGAGSNSVGVWSAPDAQWRRLNSSQTNLTVSTTPSNEAEKLYADLSTVSATTINDLRQAFQIQKLQERDARGGTRAQEIVLAHFGVRGGDARLNRPEYLGGGSFNVGITQVPQTSETATTAQGNLSAYGTVHGQSGFTKSFTEHGYIIGLINVRADLTYQRGIDRHWSRNTKYDFYWPALSRLGEQAVLNKEIYADGGPNDELVFGYQERWAEMRHNQSKIVGKMRSSATGSLDTWHLSQDFAGLPSLNETFINDTPPIDRVIAVTNEPHFIMDAYFKHTAVRPMPIDGSPGYIDHF